MRNRGRKTTLRAAGIGTFCLLLSALPRTACAAGSSSVFQDVSVGYMASTFVGWETEEAKNIVRTWTDRFHKSGFPGGTTRIDIFQDVAGMERAIRERKVDIISTVSDDFVRLRKRTPLQPILLSAHSGGVYDQAVVLARRDRGFLQWKDLRGKQITISGDKVQSIQVTWLETQLMKEGYRTPGDFFSSVKEVVKPSQAILSVFFRQADACLTTRRSFDLACELNPQVGKELAILARSDDMASGVVSVRTGYDPKDMENITEILGSMDRNPSGKQLLQIFRVDHFVPFREEYLETVEAMVKEHGELRAKPAGRR